MYRNMFQSFLESLEVSRDDHDVGAFLGEETGHTTAHPQRCTGDNYGLLQAGSANGPEHMTLEGLTRPSTGNLFFPTKRSILTALRDVLGEIDSSSPTPGTNNTRTKSMTNANNAVTDI